jgi:hypothetical protein
MTERNEQMCEQCREIKLMKPRQRFCCAKCRFMNHQKKNSPTPISTLCKLGSIAVHAQEALSATAHAADIAALKSLLTDTEVKDWLASMNKQALLPKKR